MNAALEREKEFGDLFALNTGLNDGGPNDQEIIIDPIFDDVDEEESVVRIDLLRAGFIAFLFVLSALTGYEYHRHRVETLPHIMTKRLQRKSNQVSKRIQKNQGKKNVLTVELRANAKRAVNDRINSFKTQLENYEIEALQLDIKKDEDINSWNNLKTILIADVREIYNNN